jgi:hypothetical protein
MYGYTQFFSFEKHWQGLEISIQYHQETTQAKANLNSTDLYTHTKEMV